MNYVIETGLWETDFLLNKILPEGNVNYISTSEIETINFNCDVFTFSSRVHSFSNIKNTIKRIKPKIIICLSDEFIDENLSCFNELGNYCELFLRQYHHPNYTYTSNTIHIPLGYTNGCKIFSENKKLIWSFLGEIKSDRSDMISTFQKLNPHFIGNSTTKELMCKIYSKSLFVPCGRGNSSLDCFRLYEASMNGAIPVVVGSRDEIETTFKYEENPPWIFAESWEDAYIECTRTTIDSQSVTSWWNQRINNIKEQVRKVL
jgi:hypothetical protein